jgi:hypothetical protein
MISYKIPLFLELEKTSCAKKVLIFVLGVKNPKNHTPVVPK